VPNADPRKARHVFRCTQGGRGGEGPESRTYGFDFSKFFGIKIRTCEMLKRAALVQCVHNATHEK